MKSPLFAQSPEFLSEYFELQHAHLKQARQRRMWRTQKRKQRAKLKAAQ